MLVFIVFGYFSCKAVFAGENQTSPLLKDLLKVEWQIVRINCFGTLLVIDKGSDVVKQYN